MDSVKNWYRSKSMGFNTRADFAMANTDFKSQSYGPTDRALKSAADVCKKLKPSAETKCAILNTVHDVKGYSRKFIPNENTKQKVSRFYESQVAKLKYSQLKDGFHPGERSEDLHAICDDTGIDTQLPPPRARYHNAADQEVPCSVETFNGASRLRTNSLGSALPATQDWNGSFMQFKEPLRPPS